MLILVVEGNASGRTSNNNNKDVWRHGYCLTFEDICTSCVELHDCFVCCFALFFAVFCLFDYLFVCLFCELQAILSVTLIQC